MYPTCKHCDTEATHHGKGENVCPEHIDHKNRGLYFPIPA